MSNTCIRSHKSSQESHKTGHPNRGTCGTRRESAAQEERSPSTTKAQIKRLRAWLQAGDKRATSGQELRGVDGTENTQRKEERGTRRAASKRQRTSAHCHVQQRTCVVGEGGSSRKAKSQATRACRLPQHGRFLIKQMTETAGKSKTHSSPLLALCQKSYKNVTKKLQKSYKKVTKMTRKLRLLYV